MDESTVGTPQDFVDKRRSCKRKQNEAMTNAGIDPKLNALSCSTQILKTARTQAELEAILQKALHVNRRISEKRAINKIRQVETPSCNNAGTPQTQLQSGIALSKRHIQ